MHSYDLSELSIDKRMLSMIIIIIKENDQCIENGINLNQVNDVHLQFYFYSCMKLQTKQTNKKREEIMNHYNNGLNKE